MVWGWSVAYTSSKAGLNRVNISLDTIDKQRYAQLTRRDRLDGVFKAIDAAINWS